MNSSDQTFIKSITPEIINAQVDPDLIRRLLGVIEDQENEIKKLKRNQGFDLVRGKRQKPLNYIPNRDKL